MNCGQNPRACSVIACFMGNGTDKCYLEGSYQEIVSVVHNRGAGGMRRQNHTPVCSMARSHESVPCRNKITTRGRRLRVAVLEPERANGAALKPAGVLS